MTHNNKAFIEQNALIAVVPALILVWLIASIVAHRIGTSQAIQAEQFMEIVRSEQEDRCFEGRKYAPYPRYLKSFLKHDKQSKQMVYDLSSGGGIAVKDNLYGYTLQMPSYADGRVCCDNCQKLNRKYPPCSSLKNRPDFILPDTTCLALFNQAGAEDTSASLEPDNQQEEENSEMYQFDLTPRERQMIDESQTAQADLKDVVKTESEQEQNSQGTTSQEVATEEPEDCPIEGSKGTFYIDNCSNFQAGSQGTILFTWNQETCKYEAVQNCMIPSHWESGSSEKKREYGLYPSDLETWCEHLLEENSCEDTEGVQRECLTAEETCYVSCSITEKTALEETPNIVLYDATATLKVKRCVPDKKVNVRIE